MPRLTLMPQPACLILGVISGNMMGRTMNSNNDQLFQNIPVCSMKDLLCSEWSLFLTGSSSENINVYASQSKEFTPKQIKTILINEIAMTLKDLDTIQQQEIPKTPFRDMKMKLNSQTLSLNILPSFAPSPLILSNLSVSIPIDNNGGPKKSGYVIWSISMFDDDVNHSASPKYLCRENMTYQDFLIHFCKHGLGVTQGRPIEFELFIFSNPIVFGKASLQTTTPNKEEPEHKFFFSRILSCSDSRALLFPSSLV